MNDADETQRLQALAATLQRRNLDAAARIILDVMKPIAFLASQTAVFIQPMIPRGQWQIHVDLLCEETNWTRLRAMLDQHGGCKVREREDRDKRATNNTFLGMMGMPITPPTRKVSQCSIARCPSRSLSQTKPS